LLFNNIFEPGPLSVINTGSNPGGPVDLFLNINSSFVQNNYWFDPTPDNRVDETPPSGRTDFVSIVLHEIGHGLGIAGTRILNEGLNYGKFPGYESVFDSLSFFGGDGNALDSFGNPNPMFFSGAHAMALFGAAVPLSHVGPGHPLHSQDFYHFGTCGDPLILTASLMNGCSVPVGADPRLEITALDKAVLQDIGYPIAAATTVPAPSTLLLLFSGVYLLRVFPRAKSDVV
jgi:hypothetical protein